MKKTEPPRRVLIVYGYEPSGHSAAALSLAEALRARGADPALVEVAADHHPAAGLAVARGYHALLGAVPGLWGALYASGGARAALKGVRAAYLALGGGAALRRGVARRAPDAVVCPQASVSAVFAAARARGDLAVPLAGVVTDFTTHPFWLDPAPDLLLDARAPGLPVHPCFARAPSREEARAALDLPRAAPVALVSGGGKGLGGLDRLVSALLAAVPRATVLALCGRNDRLRRALSGRAAGRLRVYGPQPPETVARLMAASDLVAGKPGGMTAAEALALGRPLLLCGVLPGQEEANAAFLLGAGAARRADGAGEAARAAAALLASPGELAALARAARAAGRPDAAGAAAEAILALAQSGGDALELSGGLRGERR